MLEKSVNKGDASTVLSYRGLSNSTAEWLGLDKELKKLVVDTTANQPGTQLSIDTPTKSTGNTDNGLMKKLKEFDGLAMSLGNGNPETGTDEHNFSKLKLIIL
ncbi:PREDICTED: G-box-binding factor 3-like [Camelina sativa]|uniref:G-box-binding factor 3-like n=1 Tax=Camelina sativa TaxID=90675 RepID=A0ABM0ULR2_CAMSA|nr:PREDICTED: G-box-binding factor 3-like [Camelina sativa]